MPLEFSLRVNTMSSSVTAYLVDWMELQRNLQLRKENEGWFFEAVENKEPWLDEFFVLPNTSSRGGIFRFWSRPSSRAWISSGHAWTDVGLAYDDLRAELDQSTKDLFDKFF